MANETVNEILQLAITMEEQGQKFYEHYANNAKGQTKDVLLRLASDEVEHAKFFKKLYAGIESSNDDYLFDETVVNTFRSYAKSAAFNRSQLGIESMSEVIKEGIKTEKLTIDYYQHLAKHTSEQTKNIINQIIAEEQRHVEILEELLTDNQ